MAPTSNLSIIDLGLKTYLYNKFGSTMGLTDPLNDVTMQPFNISLRETADKRSAVKLNFISMWRSAAAPDWDRRRTPTGRDGIEVAYSKSDMSKIQLLQAVPVDIHYDVYFWVYKENFDNLLQVTEKYIFWHDQTPTMDLTFNGIPLRYQIYTDPLTDESSTSDQYNKGNYYIYKAPVWIDGWICKLDEDWTVTKIYANEYDDNGDNPILVKSETVPS